ncbi:phosphatase PAP2 family protein [Streptomyces olivaceiscleroticus]|uniref:Phosphatase PAP2 family protein n=1 Tax=Streptomyces olivaceiscleroticus TaxID=68245 RepID=A0ABP3KIQ5_9ACTN
MSTFRVHAAPHTSVARGTRPRWWAELPLLALVYAAYSAGRLLARGDVSAATGHGVRLLDAEQLLHIDFERPLNRLFSGTPVVGIPAAFVYAALHYLVTPAVLVWLWRRHPTRYRLMRTWLLLATTIGLAGFTLLPTCPPRLLAAVHGFTDTMAEYAAYGWWGGEASAPRGLGGLTNQYAAMPSLHVGWALWCGVALWLYGGSRLTKVAGMAYPLLITVVVLGTANHYFLDTVAGSAAMVLGLLLARPALRLTAAARGVIAARASGGTPGPPANVGDGCETSAGERFPRQSARAGSGTRGAAAAGDGAARTPG